MVENWGLSPPSEPKIPSSVSGCYFKCKSQNNVHNQKTGIFYPSKTMYCFGIFNLFKSFILKFKKLKLMVRYCKKGIPYIPVLSIPNIH